MLEIIGAIFVAIIICIIFGILFICLKAVWFVFEFLFDAGVSGCLGCLGYIVFIFFVIGCFLVII